MSSGVSKTDSTNSKKSNNIIIYNDYPPTGASCDTLFNIKKPVTDGLSPSDAEKALKQYQNEINNAYYKQRMSIFTDSVHQTGRSPFSVNSENKLDDPFHYINENASGNSPVAQDYSLTLNATYKDETKTLKTKDSRSQEDTHYLEQTRVYGQHAIQGNDVPIGNTLIAYLSNDNQNATATIGNTTVEKLADNFFETADSIEKSEAPGVVRQTSKDGDKILFTNVDDPKTTKFDKSLDSTIINHDGVLSPDELNATKNAYVYDAEIFTAAKKLNKVSGAADQRASAAATVNLDNDDPYDAFFEKVAKIDGKDGVTKEELIKALDAISDKGPIDPKTGNTTLYFSKEKLNKFLGVKNQ